MTRGRTFRYIPEDIARILMDLDERISRLDPPNFSNPEYQTVIDDYARVLIARGATRSYMFSIPSLCSQRNAMRELSAKDVYTIGLLVGSYTRLVSI